MSKILISFLGARDSQIPQTFMKNLKHKNIYEIEGDSVLNQNIGIH